MRGATKKTKRGAGGKNHRPAGKQPIVDPANKVRKWATEVGKQKSFDPAKK
jgi:hypothetical protein